jgi:tripartite-type tricarboxylate transporter receptor subunit TctC
MVLAGLVAAGAMAGAFTTAQAAFPDRPITLIVPWAAGGGTDAVARQIAFQLEKDLKQPVNVVNRTGGSGVVGHQAISSAAPDGYTIGMITLEINMMHWVGLTELTSAQFTPLAMMNSDAAAIHVRADSPYKTLKDLIAAIKAAEPGKFKASGTGQGGSWHMALGGLLEKEGIDPNKVRWVPSTGAATAMTDLAAGGVDFVACSMPEAQALISAGRVRSLVFMAEKRAALFPDVPTVKEAAGHEWYKGVWRVMAGPKGMPKEVADRYEALFKKVYESQEYKDFMAKRGFDLRWMDAASLTPFLKADDQEIGQTLKSLGLAKAK